MCCSPTRPAAQNGLVQGYFAADGNAGNTSAVKGNKWRVHFAPRPGKGSWDYKVNFRKGNFAAVSDKEEHRSQWRLTWINPPEPLPLLPLIKAGGISGARACWNMWVNATFQFAGTGEYFLKVGSDAPENMLAYEDFDGTFHNDGHNDHMVKAWQAHEQHWNEGDPTWKDGKGKDIIGAINYLASKGMNAFSFLTNSVEGDDKNVFMYIDYNTWDRMDCSKLDQWEVLF